MNSTNKEKFKFLIKEEENEVIFVEPSEIIDLLKLISYDLKALGKLKKYRNKDIIVNGNLDLSDLPVTSLGDIKKINGSLNISNTKISSLGDTEITGYVTDYGTPIESKRKAKIRADKFLSANSRREDEEWNPEVYDDEETLFANALFEYLKDDIDESERPKDYEEKISKLERERGNLQVEQESYDVLSNEYDELEDKINEIDTVIEELQDSVDVYFLIPEKYKHYGLSIFEVLIPSKEGEEYTVGTEEDMDRAIREYYESFIDDVGITGFREEYWKNHIDSEKIYDEALEMYEYEVRDNPESYLSDSDRELSSSQEDEISKLEEEKEELELRLHDMNPEDDDYDEVTDRIDEIEVEIDEIKDSPEGEYNENAINEKIEEMAEYYRDNPEEYASTYGIDLSEYVDKDELIDSVISDDGYGAMSSYDGNYDSIEFKGETYYIMRIN